MSNRSALPRGEHLTLASGWNPSRNAMSSVRLVLAAVVAVTHALQLSRGWQPVLGPATELGALAVDGFFVVSGFLVAGSLMRLGSIRRYAWHRFLRIMPGFWVCLLATAFVLAPSTVLLSGGSPSAVFDGDDTSTGYVVRNALLLMRQYDIDALPASADGGHVAAGALWTLFYEALCYALVAGLGLIGLLARRRLLTLALVLLLQSVTVLQAAGVFVVPQERLLRLTLLFLLGVCATLFADRIPLSLPLAGGALVLLAVSIALVPDYRALGAASFAYLILTISARAPISWTPRWDLSYGLYIYHWPLALLLLAAGAVALPTALLVVAVLLCSAAAATASWLCVEAPAMRLRSATAITAPLPAALRRRRQRRPSTRPADGAGGSR